MGVTKWVASASSEHFTYRAEAEASVETRNGA